MRWRQPICVALCATLAGAGTTAMADSATLQHATEAETQGNHSAAIDLFTQAISDTGLTAKDRRAAYMGRGMARGASGAFADAIKDFSAAIALNPGLSDGYYERALFRSDIGDYGAAVMDMNVIESVAGSYPRYYYYRGYIHYENRDYDQAIADLTRAATTLATDPDVYYHRARAYDAKGEREQAMADYGTTIRLKPADQSTLYAAYRWHGTEAFALKNYTQAAADFDTLLRLSPMDADAAMRRASLHYARGEYAATVADASRVINAESKIEPGSVFPWPGVIDPTACFYDRIVEQYNHGIRSLGIDPYALVIRARANLKLGHKDAALADYAIAVQAIPPGADPSVAAEMAAARR